MVPSKRFLLDNAKALAGARAILGAVFVIAGTAKLLGLNDFIDQLASYEVFPASLLRLTGIALPIAELACGVMLLTGFLRRTAALAGTLMAAIFAAVNLVDIAGGAQTCQRCFGDAVLLSSRTALAIDSAMMLAGLFIFFRPGSGHGSTPSTRPWKGWRKWGTQAVRTLKVLTILLNPILTPAAAALAAPGVAASSGETVIAAQSALPSTDINGRVRSLLEAGRKVFLYFYTDGCQYCNQQKPAIEDLRNNLPESLAFVPLDASTSRDAMKEFGVTGVPTFVLIDGLTDSGYRYEKLVGIQEERDLTQLVLALSTTTVPGTSPESSTAGLTTGPEVGSRAAVAASPAGGNEVPDEGIPQTVRQPHQEFGEPQAVGTCAIYYVGGAWVDFQGNDSLTVVMAVPEDNSSYQFKFNLKRGGSSLGEFTASPNNFYQDRGLSKGGTYTYTVEKYQKAGTADWAKYDECTVTGTTGTIKGNLWENMTWTSATGDWAVDDVNVGANTLTIASGTRVVRAGTGAGRITVAGKLVANGATFENVQMGAFPSVESNNGDLSIQGSTLTGVTITTASVSNFSNNTGSPTAGGSLQVLNRTNLPVVFRDNNMPTYSMQLYYGTTGFTPPSVTLENNRLNWVTVSKWPYAPALSGPFVMRGNTMMRYAQVQSAAGDITIEDNTIGTVNLDNMPEQKAATARVVRRNTMSCSATPPPGGNAGVWANNIRGLTVEENTIDCAVNGGDGIVITFDFWGSNTVANPGLAGDMLIKGNTIRHTGKGIALGAVFFDRKGILENVLVRDNLVEENQTNLSVRGATGKTGVRNNTLYNNAFRKPAAGGKNWELYECTDCPNTWNTTKASGTNIIGGPFIGGNFWSDYYGADNDGDEIGQTPFALDGLNTDNLPLARSFVVNVATDQADASVGDGLCDVDLVTPGSQCTLRAALQEANLKPGRDSIGFNIPGTNHVAPSSALPSITDPAAIDATTQPGAGLIWLDGAGAGAGTNGLYLTAGDTAVRGFVVGSFTGHGIFLEGGTGYNLVAGNYVGVKQDGTAIANNGDGVRIRSSSNDRVGGPLAGERNYMANNKGAGVRVLQGTGGASTRYARILGNYIGTHPNGLSAQPNLHGVVVEESASGIYVGGGLTGEGNLISGNGFSSVAGSGHGVLFTANSSSSYVQGNIIGLNKDGTARLSNLASGVFVNGGANSIRVGGSPSGASNPRNVISGNKKGIHVSGSQSTYTEITGNYIGADVAGQTALGNDEEGILIEGAPRTSIGSSSTGERNIISGNGREGIKLLGSQTTNTTIQGNYIGLNATGTAALPNGTDGILVDGAPNNAYIGSYSANTGNVISGNAGNGVTIRGTTASGNVAQGNTIGLNPAGTAAIANAGRGISIEGAPTNTIGGNRSGAGNTISGNTSHGVVVSGIGATGNKLQSNKVGTNKAGTAAVANGGSGIVIDSAPNTTVGGNHSTSVPVRNIVSGNKKGIEVISSDAAGNIVQGNYVGTDVNGTLAIPNTEEGVFIGYNARNTVVGGTLDGERNLISGNSLDGVRIGTDFNETSGNVVKGNYIGTKAAGLDKLANGKDGVRIHHAINTAIGGSDAGSRNVIAGNTEYGVEIIGWALGDYGKINTVEGNYIGLNANGATAQGNTKAGVRIYMGSTNTIKNNVISANQSNGIEIAGDKSTGNQVKGNTVGADATGLKGRPNNGDGVNIADSAAGNTVGGSTAADRNVISGNDGDGVEVNGPEARTNTIQGNYIGPNATGADVLLEQQSNHLVDCTATSCFQVGNTGNGVLLNNSPENVVAGNVISLNGGRGAFITGASAASNQVRGNYIGTDKDGLKIMAVDGFHNLGNYLGGVEVQTAGNTIGSTSIAQINVISGNRGFGIKLVSTGAAGNLVAGNYVGVDKAVTKSLGNSGSGIVITNSPGNAIGGNTVDHVNVISGNQGHGVEITGSASTNNRLQHNFIGLDAEGLLSIANTGNGVLIQGAAGNVIGGPWIGEFNLISGNQGHGIEVTGTGASGNRVEGNLIGTDVAGSTAKGNTLEGVFLNDVSSNTVGGLAAGAGNLISGNLQNGVRISGATATQNRVQGNRIGVTGTGGAVANGKDGVLAHNGAFANYIGGPQANAGNIISGNAGNGVELNGIGVINNEVQGNFIGTLKDRATRVANSEHGILIIGGATSNVMGGKNAGEGNTINFNGMDGVYVASGNRNQVLGNSVLGNAGLGIDLGTNGVTPNDAADPDTGANDLQNFPVLTTASSTLSGTTIQGTLNSLASTTFRLEFFASREADPSGNGEGETLLGVQNVNTDATGNVSFTANLAAVAYSGQLISATATDPNNNTSEFSAAIALSTAPTAPTLLAEIAIVPGLDSANYAVVAAKINRVKNAGTGDTVSVADGIGSYDAYITYDAAGAEIRSVSGLGSFAAPTSALNTAAGTRTNFSASQSGAAPTPPLTVAELRIQLKGSKDVAYPVTLNFNSVTRVSGDAVPQDAAASLSLRRGDARADGQVTISDALYIAQYLAGLRGLGTDTNSVNPVNAASVRQDVTSGTNGDLLTIADALFIAQMLAGLRDASFN